MFNPKTILVPTDFSESSEYAMRNAIEIAEQFGSKLIVLYVEANDVQHMPLFYLDDDKIQEIKEKLQKGDEEKLSSFLEKTLGNSKVEVEQQVLNGIAYDEIVHFTENEDIDLLVIASHGRNAIQKFFYGSTTERVVRSAACTVLVVRKKD